ncbi:hypothetical protein GCM10008955_15360 [Deinococcus malanensis]|uniref:M23ase beta-sheet core domain-containing protein n=1 Tax=Deinococcus malanensis TaxID=1706855 RepID=A0ABQ2ERW4_9DEIO|nr:hypothetical protein GCM10008955_15360 [Deinococcus malanensis]
MHAAEGRTVTASFWHKEIGAIVLIEHPDGSEAHYWHLRDIHVRKGQYVNAGDLIGQIGKGGRGQWFAYLHFGVRKKAGQLPADYWPSTHIKDPVKCAEFIREHYYDLLAWLEARNAKKRIEDLQAQRGEPTRVLMNEQEITGQLVQFPANGVTVNARTNLVHVYVNDPHSNGVPSLPPGK